MQELEGVESRPGAFENRRQANGRRDGKLEKALTKFATEQLNLGREIGIQPPTE